MRILGERYVSSPVKSSSGSSSAGSGDAALSLLSGTVSVSLSGSVAVSPVSGSVLLSVSGSVTLSVGPSVSVFSVTASDAVPSFKTGTSFSTRSKAAMTATATRIAMLQKRGFLFCFS